MANSGERPFEFRVPQTIHVGVGCHERVVAEAARIGGGNVLVITDANVRATPAAGGVRAAILRVPVASRRTAPKPSRPPQTTPVTGAQIAPSTGAASGNCIGDLHDH